MTNPPEDPLYSTKVLIWDIEVSPNIGLFWSSGYKLTIPPENILVERAICCISWMYLGEKQVYSLKWAQDHSDRDMIDTFIGHLNNCRHSVAHNGDKFDIRWLRGRAMKHGISMWPHYVTVDTLKVVKNLAYLNSNKLDYLGEYFGLGRKQHVSFELWKDVLADVPGSLEKMVRYNRQDVRLLAAIYERLLPYMSHVDRTGRDIFSCPKCDSSDYKRAHHRFTKAGNEVIQLMCKDCRGYWTVPAGRFFKER